MVEKNDIEEKYGIMIGGCPNCQPNGSMAKNWGVIPQDARDELEVSGIYCCTENDTNGRKVHNTPTYCEFNSPS